MEHISAEIASGRHSPAEYQTESDSISPARRIHIIKKPLIIKNAYFLWRAAI